MSDFKLGFARKDITPSVGTRLYGYPGARKSQTLHDGLTVNALVFQKGNERAILISADVCTIPDTVNLTLRKIIEKETGIKYNHIILHAIHTHSGPSISGDADASEKSWGSANTEFIENIFYPQTITCVKEALNNLTCAEMGIGEIQSLVGINRREYTKDGKVILGQNPDGPLDTRMRVLSFRKTDGEIIVNLIHYGCHPTSAGQAPEISRDWPGYMTDRLEKETGAPSFFINGAEGDIGPRLSNGKTTGDMEQTEEIGIIAGEDAVKAYRTIKEFSAPEFTVKTGFFSLPFKPLPTAKETKRLMEDMGNPDDLIEVDVLKYDRYRKILNHYSSGLPIEKQWSFEQTYINVGSVLFVPFPLEIFCEISLNQQKESPFPHTLCMSNANGERGYMPTKDQIPFGGYEIDSFCSYNVFILEEDADKQIVKANCNLINELFVQ